MEGDDALMGRMKKPKREKAVAKCVSFPAGLFRDVKTAMKARRFTKLSDYLQHLVRRDIDDLVQRVIITPKQDEIRP